MRSFRISDGRECQEFLEQQTSKDPFKNNFTFVWIDRNENQEADKMAGIGREVCERKDIESRKKKEKKDAQDRESLKMIKERFSIR